MKALIHLATKEYSFIELQVTGTEEEIAVQYVKMEKAYKLAVTIKNEVDEKVITDSLKPKPPFTKDDTSPCSLMSKKDLDKKIANRLKDK